MKGDLLIRVLIGARVSMEDRNACIAEAAGDCARANTIGRAEAWEEAIKLLGETSSPKLLKYFFEVNARAARKCAGESP